MLTRFAVVLAATMAALTASAVNADRFGIIVETHQQDLVPEEPNLEWRTSGTVMDTRREDQVRFGMVGSKSFSDSDGQAHFYVLAMASHENVITNTYAYTPVPNDPDRRNVDHRHSKVSQWGGVAEVGFLAAGNPRSETWDGNREYWKGLIPGVGFVAGIQYMPDRMPDGYLGFTPNIHIPFFGPSIRLNMELYRTGEGFFPRSSIGLIVW